MLSKDSHEADPPTSAEDDALRVKRDRVHARWSVIASGLVDQPDLVTRIESQLFASRRSPEEPLFLSFASTAADMVQADPNRQLGRQIRAGALQRGAESRESVAKKHEKWQRLAEEIWTHRPDLSKSAVAPLVAARSEGEPNTIRLRIRRPQSES